MSLHDAMQELEAEDPDFFKVRNGDPESGFAVNVDLWLRDVVTISVEEAITSIKGTDDFGQPVDMVQLTGTPRLVFLDMFSCGIPIPFECDEVPLGQLMHDLAKTIYSIASDPAAYELDVEVPNGYFLKLRVERLVWLADNNEWSLIFTDEAYED